MRDHTTVERRAYSLAFVLLTRALVNGAFAGWLLWRQPNWAETFHAGSTYALADGTLGLIVAALLVGHLPAVSPPLLRLTTLVDAIVRLVAGVGLRAFPGIADVPIMAVLFFAAGGACAVVLAVMALGTWLEGFERRRRAGTSWHGHAAALFDPLVADGLLTVAVVAYVFIVAPPATPAALRALAVGASCALALGLIAAAYGAMPSWHADATPAPASHPAP